MVYIRAPDVHPAVDSLLLEHVLKPAGAVQQLILPRALSHTEDKAVVVVHINIGMVRGHIGDEIHRRVVVHQVVHIPAKEIPCVVKAAHADATVKGIRPPQRHNAGMGGPHAASGGHQLEAAAIDLVDAGNQLIDNIAEIPFLHLGPVAGVSVGIGPALQVHTVHAEKLELPLLNPGGGDVGHLKAFKVKEPSVLAGEHDTGLAALAVDLEFHIPLKAVAVFLIV